MPPIFYMLEKELIEHKIITRLPLFVLICIVLAFSFLVFDFKGNINFTFNSNMNGIQQHTGIGLHLFILGATGSLSILLTLLYLPKTLRKERQEGSAMFWRSMPISHIKTLTVKLVFALLLVPLICSMLVLTAELLLWSATIIKENQFTSFFGPFSLFTVWQYWFEFLLLMLIVSLALIPLANIMLMVSQLVSSPILVMVIAFYTLKWLPIYLFEFDGISKFFDAIFLIPKMALNAFPISGSPSISTNPFLGFIEAGPVNVVIYYIIGAIAFVTCLTLSKTNETSIRGLFAKH